MTDAIIRRARERGHANHGWLDAWHTFSFANYYDPNFEEYRALRVLNEDRVQPGRGFPPHSHRDMEIITCVLKGELEHKDSMGNGSIIRPGDFQRMSAGTGVQHSEFNASDKSVLHLLQIWIQPERIGIPPGYEQKFFSVQEREGNLKLVASRDGREGSLTLHQDVNLFSAILNPGQSVYDRIAPSRFGWIQIARGALMLNGQLLSAGDGAALPSGSPIGLETPIEGSPTELLLFDLA